MRRDWFRVITEVTKIRVARSTDRLEAVTRMGVENLVLKLLATFLDEV